MRNRTRSLALLGAASALATPAAIALADEPAADGPAGTIRPELGDASVRAEMRDHLHDRLVRQYDRLSRKAGDRDRSAHLWSNLKLRRQNARLRNELRTRGATTTTTAAGGSAATPQMQAIAACESGGNPRAIGGGGAFRGKYQFTYATWAAVGGSGDPAAAPEAEQDRRAAALMATSGAHNWPVCGS